MRILLLLALICGFARAEINPTWTTAQKPFRIAGNLYYVGSQDLAAYLVTTPAGNILINANLQSSPPQIRASVEQLGFKWADTRVLLISQAHYDHAAGAAEVLRETGARMMVMDGDVNAVETGDSHDFGGSDLLPFPPAHVSRVLHDNDTVVLGGVTLTAHRTAGHTRGTTTWTIMIPADTADPRSPSGMAVIVGGFSALSSYRLVATPGHPASYPGILADFREGFATERALPCVFFLGAHGSYFDMQKKLAEVPARGAAAWVDPTGYQQAITEAERNLDQHLQKERLLK